MNTAELLSKLNFKTEQMSGFYVDSTIPNEFILSIAKDNGAERWKLYGDKKNFVIALGSDSKHQVISVCPIEDAISYVSDFLSKSDEAEKSMNTINKFMENRHKAYPAEELYAESAVDFLNGKAERTLETEEIKNEVNKFRVKSGYDATFDLNGDGATFTPS